MVLVCLLQHTLNPVSLARVTAGSHSSPTMGTKRPPIPAIMADVWQHQAVPKLDGTLSLQKDTGGRTLFHSGSVTAPGSTLIKWGGNREGVAPCGGNIFQ